MEDTRWEERLNTVTHILTTPTTTPTLHSQYLISTQLPCYLNWDYPPLLCPHPNTLLKWTISSFFLKRLPFFGRAHAHPLTSWRSKCPYSLPTPLLLAHGVHPPMWDDESKRLFLRSRLRRRRLQSRVNPWVPFLGPNLFLFSLLLWNPFPEVADS
ncbi:hypothetical protein vseg_017492 [Gypsophila vaccaria]